MSTALGFFDKDKYNFNPFVASGAIGMCIDEFNGDNFDHGPLGFVGGGYIGQVQTNGRPIENTAVPPGHAGLGRESGSRRSKTIISRPSIPAAHATPRSTAIATIISSLDPTYKDRFGRPLVRLTIDFHDNEIKMSAFLTDKYAEILQADGREANRQAAAQGPLRRHRSTRPRISTAAPSWATIRATAR